MLSVIYLILFLTTFLLALFFEYLSLRKKESDIIKNDIIKTLTKIFLVMSIVIGFLIAFTFFNKAKKTILETSFANFVLCMIIIYVLVFTIFATIEQFYKNNNEIKESFEKKTFDIFFFKHLGNYKEIYIYFVYIITVCSLFNVFYDMNLINMNIA